MPRTLILLMLLPLAACMGGARQSGETAYYDLATGAATTETTPQNIRSVEVVAPSWLSSNRMQYRLAYSDPTRRREYAGSRWVAPPAEMLAQGLRKTLVSGTGACRLRLELEEFVQVFDAAENSRASLEMRAALLPLQGDAPLARRTFTLNRHTASADARGGAAALNEAAVELSNELRSWLAGAAGVAAACGGK